MSAPLLAPLTHGALCNGIGGFALAAQRAGIRTAWTCEVDPFCNAVSRKHFPHAHQYLSIYDVHHPPRVDIISAGYPCQPASYAGKRRGPADDRWLWPEVLRLLAQCRPRWFLGENVAGHLTLGLESVLADLEAEGFEVWPLVLPACAVDAPHRRDRVWIIAHAHHRQPVSAPQALRPGRDAAGPGGEAAPDPDSQRRGQPRRLLVTAPQGEGSGPGSRDNEPAATGRPGGGWDGYLLNPRFVLEMMGFPATWCDLTEAEMKQVRQQIRATGKKTRAIGPATPSKPLVTP